MTLLEIRTQCVKFSGRTDLVVNTTAYVDDGMDFFIEAGRRFIDSKVNTENSLGLFAGTLTVSDNTFDVTGCRAITDLYMTDADGDKFFPRRLTYRDFIREYPQDISAETKGEPVAWAVNIKRDIVTPVSADEILKSIIFSPSVDLAYGIVVEGEFFSEALSDDADVNYWSQQFPDLLVFAALYKLELSYRNTEGANDWLRAMEQALPGIDNDMAEQDAAGDSRMVG